MEESRGRGAGGRRGARQPEVKVTHIITTEVSADEASFKDVVQRLTGKDSAPARAAVLLAASSGAAPQPQAGPSRVNNGSAAGGIDRPGAAPPSTFDGALLPSLEEMNRWWGTHN